MNTTTSATTKETGAVSLAPDASPTLKRMALRRFLRHRLAIVGVLILTVLALAAIFAPVLYPIGPYKTNARLIRQPPSSEHILGTDAAGRDVFSRLLYGGRVSLAVGLVAVSISSVIGVVLGSLSGYYGGLLDEVLVRIAEAVICFPRLILIITIVSVVGPSFVSIMAVIGLLGWPGTFRLVRSQFLSLRERDFIMAARVAGAKDMRIIFSHTFPNSLSPVIVAATLGIAGAILTEASLGFLGLGVRPPMASWGNMLNAAQGLPYLENMPWLWVPPALMISLSVISINLIGDALRDALDPRLSNR